MKFQNFSWLILVFGITHNVTFCAAGCAVQVQGKSYFECTVKHCPDDWVRYKGTKCFKLFSFPSAQSGAEIACKNIQSTLAAVSSEEELLFLNSYIAREAATTSTPNTWVGGLKREGLWFWSDLSPFSYTKWWPGHPNTSCATIVTYPPFLKDEPTNWGKMASQACDTNSHYICQKFQTDASKSMCQL